MSDREKRIETNAADVQKRFETLIRLYEEQFLVGLD